MSLHTRSHSFDDVAFDATFANREPPVRGHSEEIPVPKRRSSFDEDYAARRTSLDENFRSLYRRTALQSAMRNYDSSSKLSTFEEIRQYTGGLGRVKDVRGDSSQLLLNRKGNGGPSLPNSPFLSPRRAPLQPAGDKKKRKKSTLLGLMEGVYVPCVAAVFGTIIFLRLPRVVGQAGVGLTLVMEFIWMLLAILSWTSLCTVTTNGVTPAGGPYYVVSRSLGKELGGSIGLLYYVGLLFTVSLHCLGSAEALFHTVFERYHYSFVDDKHYDVVLLALIVLVAVTVFVRFGIRLVSMAEVILLVFVAVVLLSIFVGFIVAPRSEYVEDHYPNITGFSSETWDKNWHSEFDDGNNFFSEFAILLPSIVGIISGLNRSGDLRDSRRTIPRGTLYAILTTMAVYVPFTIFLGWTIERDLLKSSSSVFPYVGWPKGQIVEAGVFLSAVAEALQVLLVAPRILQAMSADSIIPVIGQRFATSVNGEPRPALYMTVILAMPPLLADLEDNAVTIAMFLLFALACINVAVAVQTLLRDPNFRPRWSFYHWSTSLLGAAIAFVVMFFTRWWAALLVVLLAVVFYQYIEWKEDETDWGTGIKGIQLHRALTSLLKLEGRGKHSRNFRPQILCLMKLSNDGSPKHPELLNFVQQLKKGRGLLVVAGILEGKFSELYERSELSQSRLREQMEQIDLPGFAQVLVSSSFREGVSSLIQNCGIGKLSPNTVVMGWPRHWNEPDHEEDADAFIEALDLCAKSETAVVVCMGMENFPSSGSHPTPVDHLHMYHGLRRIPEEVDLRALRTNSGDPRSGQSSPTHKIDVQRGEISLWWIVHDGGLELLIAFLLKKHRVWRKCRLHIYSVADERDDVNAFQLEIENVLYYLRIPAKVTVVVLSMEDLEAFEHDRDEIDERRHRVIEELAMDEVQRDVQLDEIAEAVHHHRSLRSVHSRHLKFLQQGPDVDVEAFSFVHSFRNPVSENAGPADSGIIVETRDVENSSENVTPMGSPLMSPMASPVKLPKPLELDPIEEVPPSAGRRFSWLRRREGRAKRGMSMPGTSRDHPAGTRNRVGHYSEPQEEHSAFDSEPGEPFTLGAGARVSRDRSHTIAPGDVMIDIPKMEPLSLGSPHRGIGRSLTGDAPVEAAPFRSDVTIGLDILTQKAGSVASNENSIASPPLVSMAGRSTSLPPNAEFPASPSAMDAGHDDLGEGFHLDNSHPNPEHSNDPEYVAHMVSPHKRKVKVTKLRRCSIASSAGSPVLSSTTSEISTTETAPPEPSEPESDAEPVVRVSMVEMLKVRADDNKGSEAVLMTSLAIEEKGKDMEVFTVEQPADMKLIDAARTSLPNSPTSLGKMGESDVFTLGASAYATHETKDEVMKKHHTARMLDSGAGSSSEDVDMRQPFRRLDGAVSSLPNSPTGSPMSHRASVSGKSPLQRFVDSDGAINVSSDVEDEQEDFENLMRTSRHLNRLIARYSSRSALVIINLPAPREGRPAAEYMQYVERLCRGLDRVVLVRGSGAEVVTIYS